MTEVLTLGSYRLIAELGHGGMADVYLAAAEGPRGSGFTKLAVVKKLRSHLAADPDFISMLMDEARITARLSHPNVVQLFEAGQAGEDFFLAMEFLEGQPLHRIEQRAARTRTNLPREVYYSIVSDVLAGLHHAHELRDYDGTPLDVAHRDVTPHNVFVTYDGAVKVLDFGIAKASGRSCETQQGIVKGKVRYMSPEQVCGHHVDRRTDIFAAGVILWNLATGTNIWGDRADIRVSLKLQSGDYEASPRTLFPAVPEEIDAICRRALAFRREDRYATADEMREELEAFLGRDGFDARRKLGSTMRELFVSERAKLRTVLETSGLTGSASFNTLAASGAIAARAPLAARSGATQLAVTRDVVPPPEAPAIEPPSTPSVAPRVAAAPVPPAKPTMLGRASRVAQALAIGAFAATVLVVGVRVALPTRPLRAGTHVPAATVTPDLTTFGGDPRTKLESTPAGKTSLATRRTPVSFAGHGSAREAAPEPAASKPGPAASTVETAKPPRKRSALDTADPWVSTDAR